MKTYPKLTAEIFDLPNCPDWAVAAAVDRNGRCYVYRSVADVRIDADLQCHFPVIVVAWVCTMRVIGKTV